MGWDFISQTHIKKTKKPHKCAYCGRIIPAGSPDILHWCGKFDGDFQSSYSCHWCQGHQRELTEDDEIIDFWDAMRFTVFFDECEKHNLCDCFPDPKYPHLSGSIVMRFDGDDMTWVCEDCGKEWYRVSMPIVNREAQNGREG